MYVERYGDGSFGAPIVHYKKVVASQEEVDRLKGLNVADLFIDTEKSQDIDSGKHNYFKKVTPRASRHTNFSEEILVARKTYLKALAAVKDIFTMAREGESVNTACLDEPAEEFCLSVGRNINAAASLTTLKNLGDYTFTHSVNVGILSAAFGSYLGLPEKLVKDLAIAGMLHDLGKIGVKKSILQKPGRLTPSELAQAKQHSLKGYNLIRENSELNSQVIRGVLEHHERFDGSGYPRGISGVKIGVYARILAIADVYAAMTSDRPYKKAVLPNSALKLMFRMKDKFFYPQYLEQFIKCIGIYPAGSLVRISDGRAGIVVHNDPEKPLCPVLKIVLDRKMRPVKPEVLDIGLEQDSNNDVMISQCVDPHEFGLNIDRLLY